jgi:hypothetical protein
LQSNNLPHFLTAPENKTHDKVPNSVASAVARAAIYVAKLSFNQRPSHLTGKSKSKEVHEKDGEETDLVTTKNLPVAGDEVAKPLEKQGNKT